MPEIKGGQIWREVDPRHERFIRVRYLTSRGPAVGIETVEKCLGRWIRKSGTRRNEASPERFHGKRGGYELAEDVES